MDIDKYYISLGRFVDRFADAEDHIFIALQNVADLNSSIGRALLSGTRVRGAIDFIKRLYEAKDEVPPPRLLEALSQLAAINTTRDHILHSAVRMENNAFTSSNQIRAHAPRTLKVIPISPEILDAMTADLETVMIVLARFLTMQWSAEDFDDPNNRKAQAVISISQRPWRYKPVQPNIQGPLTPKTTRKPKRQPRSSQE